MKKRYLWMILGMLIFAMFGCSEDEVAQTQATEIASSVEEEIEEETDDVAAVVETTEIQQEPSSIPSSEPVEEYVFVEPENTAVWDDSARVNEKYHYDITYRNRELHYYVPAFNDPEGTGDEEINERIENDFHEIYDTELENMEGDVSISFYYYGYTTYNDGDVVSVVISAESLDNDYAIYWAYSYDYTNHCEITSADYLARHGVSEEDFYQRVTAIYDTYYQTLIDEGQGDMLESDDFKEAIEYQYSREHISGLQVFFDEQGKMYILEQFVAPWDQPFEVYEIP